MANNSIGITLGYPEIPDTYLPIEDISLLIQQKAPDIWRDAGLYDMSMYESYLDEQTGEQKIHYPYKHSEELVSYFEENPNDKARYIMENVLPSLKEISLEHYQLPFPANIAEKWKYGVAPTLKETGFAQTIASISEMGLDVNTFLNKWAFRGEQLIKDYSLTKDMTEEDKESYNLLKQNLDKFREDYTDKDLFEEPLDDKLINSGHNFLYKVNNWAEDKVRRNMKENHNMRLKDPRYAAYQNYVQSKPAEWFNTFKSPEYFVDTVFGMIPSAMVMGSSALVGSATFAATKNPLYAKRAGAAVAMTGFGAMVGTQSYNEAYEYLLNKTGDENIAENGAAYATAASTAITLATEGWGSSVLLKRFLPESFTRAGRNTLARKITESVIKNEETVNAVMRMKDKTAQKLGFLQPLKLPLAEATQEFVQYNGEILVQAGYKDERISDLIRPEEMSESVVGGALFGGFFEGVGQVTKRNLWKGWTDEANKILTEDYGIETNVAPEGLVLDNEISIHHATPNLNNYLNELIGLTGKDRTRVDRPKDSKSPLNKLIRKQDKYSKSVIAEKISEVIIQEGKDEWDELEPEVKEEVNAYLRGSIGNISKRVLESLPKNKDGQVDVANLILNKKLSISSVNKQDDIRKSNKNRLIKIQDKAIANEIMQQYESEITAEIGKESSPKQKLNYLKRQKIEIQQSIKKDIESSIQKDIKKSTQKGIEKSIQREVDKEVQREIEKETEKEIEKGLRKQFGGQQVEGKGKATTQAPKIVGQKALIDKGEYKGQSGKIAMHSPKKGLVTVKLQDGTKTKPIPETSVILPEMSPTGQTVKTPSKEITGKKGETKVETIVDAKGRTITYFATTKDKGGVKHTTYTFNRSDKKESQRNKGGVSPEVAFGDKYKAEEGYLEEFGEDAGDVWTVDKVFEVREGDGASADVTLINQDGDKLPDITLPLQKKKPKASTESIAQKETFDKKLPKMKLAQLREIGKERGIEGSSKMQKAKLVKAIKALPPTKTIDEAYDFGDKKETPTPTSPDSISKDLDVLGKKQDKLFGESDETIALKVEEKLYDKYDLWDDAGDLPAGNELIKIEQTGLDYKEDWTGEKFSITEKAKEILNSSELKELQLNVDEVNNIEEQASKIIKKSKDRTSLQERKKETQKLKKEAKIKDKKTELSALKKKVSFMETTGKNPSKRDLKKIKKLENDIEIAQAKGEDEGPVEGGDVPIIFESKILPDKTKKVGIQVNKEQVLGIAKKDILGNHPEKVLMNELLQNSFDAGADNVWIEFMKDTDADELYILFRDDGIGMSPTEVEKALLTYGNVGTKGEDTAGGYGRAKAAFLLAPDEIHVETRKNNISTTIVGTKQDLMSADIEMKTKRIDGPSGTKFVLKFYGDEALNRYQLEGTLEQQIPLIGKPLKVHYKENDSSWRGKIKEQTFTSTPLETYKDRFESQNFDILDSDVEIKYIKSEPYKKTSLGGGYIVDVNVLNKGLPQPELSEVYKYKFKIPAIPDFKIIINFKKTPTTDSENYPFIRNRSDFLSDVKTKINQSIRDVLIKKTGEMNMFYANQLKKEIDEAQEFSGVKLILPDIQNTNDRNELMFLIHKNEELFNQVGKVFNLFNNEVKKVEGRDILLAITVNNKTHGWRPNVERLKELSIEVPELYAINPFSINNAYLWKRENKTWNEPTEIELNEWIKSKTIDELNKIKASNFVHTMMHEWTHNYVEGHNEDFTMKLGELYAKVSHQILALIENEAMKIFKDGEQHEKIYKQINEVYERLGDRTSGILENEAIVQGFQEPEGKEKSGILSTGDEGKIPEGTKIERLSNLTGVDQFISASNIEINQDSANLARAIEKFKTPELVAQHFDSSYQKMKNKYGIELSDYVPAMSKALKVIESREVRDTIKNYLSEWAVSVDPEISTKMRRDNDSFQIVELMGFGGRKRRALQRQIADLRVVDNIVNTLDGRNVENSHDLSREGLTISNSSDVEEISNDMTFDTYDFAGDRFFKFLENSSARGFLTARETSDLLQEVTVNDYDGLLEYLNKKYQYTPETISDNNMVKSFWVRNQPINRQDSSDKPSFWYANLTLDGKRINSKTDFRFVPKIGGHPRYGKDIRNNQDLPRTVGVSFIDWDNKSYDWNFGELKYSRIHLKDIVRVYKDESKGGYYSRQPFLKLSSSMIRTWDRKLAQFADSEKGSGLASTVVQVKASGGSPSFVVVRASKEIMEIASEPESFVEYLDYEVSIGNIDEKIKQGIIDSVANEMEKSRYNNHVMAQHIVSHEAMKRWRGRDYLMRTPSVSHHSRRLGIDDGEGVVALGTGEYSVKILDQSKLFISKGMPGSREATTKIPMVSFIAGLPDKYHGDGSVWVESEFLDKTAESIGRVPTGPNSSKLREIKTRIRFVSKNDEFGNKHYRQKEKEQTLGGSELIEGSHYLAMKHNEFVPEEDIYITDENDNVIVRTANENGKIRIYDGDNNRITMFATLDEAKEPDGGSGVFKLNGRVSTDILTLPEESRRIIKVPKQQGHNSASFPWMWMSHLYDSKFDNLRNALSEKMLNVATSNMDTLFAARSNPQVMRALMGQFKSDGLSIMSEVDRLIEPLEGQMIQDGFMHPHISSGVIEPVKNKMLKENAYGGRRRGFGSFPVIKSDLNKDIVKKEDGIVISADDVTMVRFLKDLLNVSGFGNDLINNMNEALRNRKEYLLVGRWPVYTTSGVFLGRIEKIMPKGHGSVVWIHPESAIGNLQADHDGDTAFLLAPYFGMNYQDRSVINSMKAKETKEAFDSFQNFVRLEYFSKGKDTHNAFSKEHMYSISGKIGSGLNSQGILMNSVQFLQDMHYKGFKAEIAGQKIIARNPDSENVVMNYAKLNDDITQEMLDKAKMGSLVNKDGTEWKSGDKYLKTSAKKELHILLQAAVDNAKEYLLYNWGYNGYEFLIPKMFIQDNGSPIGKKQAGSIGRLIRKELQTSLSRRGVSSVNNRSEDFSEMFNTSREMYEMNKSSGVEKGQIITEKANTRREKFGPKSNLAKETLPIDKITFNNKTTTLEKLIAIPHESLLKYQKNNPNDNVHEHPLGYHENRIVRAIMQTQKDLYTIQKGTQRYYPETRSFEKDKQEARRFINEVAREFYKIMMTARSFQDATKSLITSSGYPYQEKLIEFIDKWVNKGDKKKGLPSWNKMSDDQQAYSTLRFLRGVLKFSSSTKRKIGEREKKIAKAIIETREKIAKETNPKKIEYFKNQIVKMENNLSKLHEPQSYLNISRARDIEKLLPMPLMHPTVWSEFANRFGPNLREASNEKISLKTDARYEDRNDKTLEQLLKDCP